MPRRKPKFPKQKVTITLPGIIYNAASEDIENFSAFFTQCLIKHLCSSLKDPVKQKCLFEKYGVDLIFIMRSSKFSKDLGILHPIDHEPTIEETLALIKDLGLDQSL